METDELVFLPLGGAGEIGMNLSLYGYGPKSKKKWIIVDCGIGFGVDETLGIDAVVPDPAFLSEIRDDILAVVLTHGHEDHIGAVPLVAHVLDCPVYATEFTGILLSGKLAERDLTAAVDLKIVEPGRRISVGPFCIEFVPITHSIPDSNLVVISTELGVVAHTGDWKFDRHPVVGRFTDLERLQELGNHSVLAVVGDSTNVFVPGHSTSESDVQADLIKAVSGASGRVFLTSFASNVARIKSAILAAETAGRKTSLIGRSLWKYHQAALDAGLLFDLPMPMRENEAASLPHDKVLWICAGSQGQANSALDRLSRNESRAVSVSPGDRFIFSSREIPGNGKKISELKNRLVSHGAEIFEGTGLSLHSSGHPCREDLRWLYSHLRPQILVPVHGEIRHLEEHKRFALSLGVPQSVVPKNGDMLRLAPGPVKTVSKVHAGILALDGSILLDLQHQAYRDRYRMARSGAISLTCILSPKFTIAKVYINVLGLPPEVEQEVAEYAAGLEGSFANRKDAEDRLRKEVRRLVKRLWHKQPELMITIHITQT